MTNDDRHFTLKVKEGAPDTAPGTFKQGTLVFKIKADNYQIRNLEAGIRDLLSGGSERDVKCDCKEE